MEMVSITCPHCGLSKSAPENRIPKGSVRAVCPKCRHDFAFHREGLVPARQAVQEHSAVKPYPETEKLEVVGNKEDAPSENTQRLFYKIVSYRVSLREYWWGSKGNPVVFLLAVLLKILRIHIPSSTDDPNVESLKPFEIKENELPEDIRSRIRPMMAEFHALGFHSPVFHYIRDGINNTKTGLVSYLSRDGNAVGRVHLRIWSQPHPEKIYVYPEFLSSFKDASFLWSLASKPDMTAPSCCNIIRKQAASAGELWAAHQKALAEASRRNIVQRIHNGEEELKSLMERHHAAVRDFHLRRGVFKAMSAEEFKKSVETEVKFLAAEADGLKHVEVLEEIERQQQPKHGWSGALWMFAISMVLFVSVGAAKWSWEYILIIVFVLMLHESGHFIAMKIFKYGNLRIFFIPFFGAAVSGRNFNAPVWKKVIVSLMGPVPGIVFGIVSCMAGLILHNSILLQIGILSLILNGLNLLPVLPLDGGRIVHYLFFSRHYIFESGFRLLAALALIAVGFGTGDKILGILGAFMLITLAQSHRQARIAFDLRKRGFRAVSDNDRLIPVEQAETIINEVKKAFPKRLTNKIIAQYTINIFETISSRPPGWAATLGLAGLHLGSLVVAVLFAGAFLILKFGR